MSRDRIRHRIAAAPRVQVKYLAQNGLLPIGQKVLAKQWRHPRDDYVVYPFHCPR